MTDPEEYPTGSQPAPPGNHVWGVSRVMSCPTWRGSGADGATVQFALGEAAPLEGDSIAVVNQALELVGEASVVSRSRTGTVFVPFSVTTSLRCTAQYRRPSARGFDVLSSVLFQAWGQPYLGSHGVDLPRSVGAQPPWQPPFLPGPLGHAAGMHLYNLLMNAGNAAAIAAGAWSWNAIQWALDHVAQQLANVNVQIWMDNVIVVDADGGLIQIEDVGGNDQLVALYELLFPNPVAISRGPAASPTPLPCRLWSPTQSHNGLGVRYSVPIDNNCSTAPFRDGPEYRAWVVPRKGAALTASPAEAFGGVFFKCDVAALVGQTVRFELHKEVEAGGGRVEATLEFKVS